MSQHFNYNGTTIAYNVYGKGMPVLLLHGFGEDSRIWDQQLPALEPCCQAIVPDLPGSGQSQMLQPQNGQPVTIEHYADAMKALADSMGIEKMIVCGHSMGGYIALAYAEKYADSLVGLGLLHATAFADSEEKKENRRRGIEMIEQYGGAAFLKNTIPNLFAAAFKKEQPHQVNVLIERGREFSNDALTQYYEAMILRPDRTHVLRNATFPLLFILGTDDVAAPLGDLMKQVNLPQVAYIHILKNTGHMGMWEAADQFNQHLSAYISGIEKR